MSLIKLAKQHKRKALTKDDYLLHVGGRALGYGGLGGLIGYDGGHALKGGLEAWKQGVGGAAIGAAIGVGLGARHLSYRNEND